MIVDTTALEIACEQVLNIGSFDSDISPIPFASDLTWRSLPKSKLNAVIENNADASTLLMQLEEKVAILKHTLRLRANNIQMAMAPVNRLPTEILCDIFHMVHRSSFSLKPSLALSHVCGRWRSIALELPELWTFVDISSSCADEMLAEFSRRSRDYDLCLSTESPFSLKDYPLLIEQPLAQRVRSINLTLPNFDHAMFASIVDWPCDLSPRPILETLVISHNGPSHPILQVRGMPPAQKLEVRGVTLTGDAAVSAQGGVKHLHICALLASAYGSTIHALQPFTSNLETLWLERINEWNAQEANRMELFLHATRPISPISLRFTECTPKVWLSTLEMCAHDRLETLVLDYSQYPRYFPSLDQSRLRDDVPVDAHGILRAFVSPLLHYLFFPPCPPRSS